MPDYSTLAPVFQQYLRYGTPGVGQPGTPGNRAPGGAINPLPSFGWSPGYGGTPAVPNPTTTAGNAITGNTANFGGAANLAALTNLFNQQQQQNQLIRGLPNYSAMVNTSSGNILNELEGKVPTDVVRMLEQTAAERGISTGTAGSPSGNAALLRAMGLTSLDLTQRGESNLTGAISRTPTVPLLNPATFFVNPEQQQQAESAAALYGSAPNPAAAAEEAIRQARAGASAGYPGRGFGPPGGGGGGGSPFGGDPGAYARQPFAADRMINPPAGGALGPSDLYDLHENAPAWNQWMGSLPGRSAMGGGGNTGQGTTGMYGPEFMNQEIGQNSDTWNQLMDMGIDPSGWTRQDAASILGVNAEDLDLGAPAAATPTQDYGGGYEEFYGGGEGE
jgi:hypothetical protein